MKKEILTVDNHCDGVYLYLKALAEGDESLAGQIKDFLLANGGTVPVSPLGRLTQKASSILTSLPATLPLAT